MLMPALADPAAGGSLLSNPDLWRVINLLVFVVLLVYILRNKLKIGRVFDNRAATIVKELEEARRDKQAAEEQLNQLTERLTRLDQEVAEIRAEAEREAAREDERIREGARADAEKIRQMAEREITGAMKAARTELRAFVAEHAVEMAEATIRREIRPEDNSRILDKYIEQMREVNR